MNIVVRTFSGNIVVRPDTTWVRKDEDFYVPDFVDTLSVSNVICARISRPGKCVGTRFAERYYDAVGRGMLFYPENLIGDDVEAYANAICLGHSSYIHLPESDKSSFSADERMALCNAIAEATKMSLIRTGDIMAVETCERKQLCSRECGVYPMPDFKIRF